MKTWTFIYFTLLVLEQAQPCKSVNFKDIYKKVTSFVSGSFNYETCSDKWIINNVTALKNNIRAKMYGQHLVEQTVLPLLAGHLSKNDPSKALVLVFHGPTGVGKSYLSQMIAKSLYAKGVNSKFVHTLIATRDFLHHHLVRQYKDQLKSWIEGNVTLCERSLFIFDEVDKLPVQLLDVVTPYLDYHMHISGVNYRKSIFLFLSNTGDLELSQHTFELWKSGKKRESLRLADVEHLLMSSAFNVENNGHRLSSRARGQSQLCPSVPVTRSRLQFAACQVGRVGPCKAPASVACFLWKGHYHNKVGLWQSQLISKHLVSTHVPFLPLEREHVRSCIRNSLVREKYFKNAGRIPKETVEKVMDEMTFSPKKEQLYSIKGCKNVKDKMDLVMMELKNTEIELQIAFNTII